MIQNIIDKISRWLEATGTAPTTLGKRACGNPRALERIWSRQASIATLEAVLTYMAEHPPKKPGRR